MLSQLLLQVVLILLNAFFAATEIAVISLNEKKVKAKADSGNKKALKMLKMIEEPTKFLSTIQIGITLAGFLGSAFAADNFAERLSGWLTVVFEIPIAQMEVINTLSVVIITLLLSFVTLVFGELVPKRMAMKYKEQLAEYVCDLISILATVLSPIIWIVTFSTTTVLRLFGISDHDGGEPVSEEDIVIMLDAAVDEGAFDKEDAVYMKNIFKLDRLSAVDIMTPRKQVVSISVDSQKEEILELIKEEGYSRIPVYSEDTDNMIGILYARDYLIFHEKEDFQLTQAMFAPTYVPESIKLDVLFKKMQREHNHIVIVVDEYGTISGVVTMEDILEELVGEIWDERDESVDMIRKISDTEYLVSCAVSLEDFSEYFKVRPDSEAATVNGWLVEMRDSIPKEKDCFIFEHLSLTVEKANSRMAIEMKVEKN